MMLNMTNREKRCEDCASLVKVNGCWCCDECFNQKCNDIDDCPEGIELSEVEENQEKGKNVKINHGVVGEKRKSTKPRTVKVSDAKKQLFSEIFTNLEDVYGGNAQIAKENKLIIVQIDEKVFKIDIVEQRQPKK